MSSKLISIIGIDTQLGKILNQKSGIKTVKQLYDATRTTVSRKELAEKTGLSLANVTHWATQAELLRMNEMSVGMAYDFIDSGIYSVEQIQSMTDTELYEKVKSKNIYSAITPELAKKIKAGKVSSAEPFETDSIRKELVATETKTPSIYTDLSDIISNLGKGIANAQFELDKSSIAIQNKILEDDRLYNMGLQATWYAIPETEFTLKMDYTVSEERTVTGSVISGSKIYAAPVNATFNNFFKTEKKEESALRVRFVPIPAGDRMLERRFSPNFSKATTMEELEEILEENDISLYNIINAEKEKVDDTYKKIIVISQEPEAGKFIKIGQTVEIIVKKMSKDEHIRG